MCNISGGFRIYFARAKKLRCQIDRGMGRKRHEKAYDMSCWNMLDVIINNQNHDHGNQSPSHIQWNYIVISSLISLWLSECDKRDQVNLQPCWRFEIDLWPIWRDTRKTIKFSVGYLKFSDHCKPPGFLHLGRHLPPLQGPYWWLHHDTTLAKNGWRYHWIIEPWIYIYIYNHPSNHTSTAYELVHTLMLLCPFWFLLKCN